MIRAKQFFGLVLGATLGVAAGAALDRGITQAVEAQLKNSSEGVSQLPQN